MPNLSPEQVATLLGIGIAIGWMVRYLFPQLGFKTDSNHESKTQIALLTVQVKHLKEDLEAGIKRIEKKIDDLIKESVGDLECGLKHSAVESRLARLEKAIGKD